MNWERFYQSFRKPGYIPGFEIVNKLGGGVFGVVYKARKESIGKFYAIKFLKLDDESVKDAVVRELEAVKFFAQIDHPNLVSIEDKGVVDGIPYIVMGYAGEETLKKRLEQGRMTEEDALRVFVQTARGVHALHERSLIHFDLKPANVFLRGDIARVGDYGLSKLVSESRNTLSFGRGTPYYMAPEMLRRRGDHRSDVYSLGVILYEMLAGDVPFKGDSEWEVLKKHETEVVRFPSDFPDKYRALVGRALEKDPLRRQQSIAEVLREVQAPAALLDSILIRETRRPPAPSPAAAHAPAAEAAGEAVKKAVGHALVGVEGARHRVRALRERWSARIQERGESTRRGASTMLGAAKGFAGVVARLAGVVAFIVLLPMMVLWTASGYLLKGVLIVPFKLVGFAVKVSAYLVGSIMILLLLVAVLEMFS
jgi:tRNA A-37 threonylcarbamoyl transferase component Bud32